jgi:hypothetical protein
MELCSSFDKLVYSCESYSFRTEVRLAKIINLSNTTALISVDS